MKKKYIIGAVIGLVALGYYISSKANDFISNIKYRFSNARVSFGLNTKLTIDLKITNENDFDVEVINFIGDIYYGDDDLGNVSSGELLLPALTSDTTEMEVDIKLIDLVSTALTAISSGNYLGELWVRGKIRARNPQSGITLSIPYKKRVF